MGQENIYWLITITCDVCNHKYACYIIEYMHSHDYHLCLKLTIFKHKLDSNFCITYECLPILNNMEHNLFSRRTRTVLSCKFRLVKKHFDIFLASL